MEVGMSDNLLESIPPMPCKVAPWRIGDGARNMAWDEAMLRLTIEDPARAWLRVYSWSEPTLSLGYFQELEQALANPRWRNVPIVRRPTGGGALWHDGDGELTYAVVLPPSHPFCSRYVQAYESIHDAIGQLVRDQGWPEARRRGSATAKVYRSRADRPFLCFADSDENDLILNSVKILGSAQRRRDQTLLQHGGLLLKASGQTLDLPGLKNLPNLTNNQVSFEPMDWADPVLRAIAKALNLDIKSANSADLAKWDRCADDCEREIYLDPAWLRRR